MLNGFKNRAMVRAGTAGAFSLSNALSSSMGIVLAPVILRKIGLAEYGMLGLAMFVYAIFFALVDFGLQSHLVVVSSRRDGGKGLGAEIVNAMALKLLLFAACAAAYLAYRRWFPHPALVKDLAGIYLLTIPLSTIHLEWFFIAKKIYRPLITARLTVAALSAALVGVWYFRIDSVLYLPVVLGFSQACGFLFLLYRMRPCRLWDGPAKPSFRHVKSMFLSLMPMAGTQALSPFFLTSGIFLMERMSASADLLGAYNLSNRMIAALLGLIAPMVIYFIPHARAADWIHARYFRETLVSAGLTLISAGLGWAVILFFYVYSRADMEQFPVSIRVFLILLLGIFLNLVRLKPVSRFVASGRYAQYFMIHLAACAPILVMAYAKFLPSGPTGVAALACVPELALTSFFLIADARAGARRGVTSAYPAGPERNSRRD